MKFIKQDREDYKDFLRAEIKKENTKPDTIAKYSNISNLYDDLNSL